MRLARAAALSCVLILSAFVPTKASASRIHGVDNCTQQGCSELRSERVRTYRTGKTSRSGRHIRSRSARTNVRVVAHPAGCPGVKFCGCGVSVRVFGHPVRDLYLADNWTRFPRASAAAGMVGWRPGHVVYIEQVHGDGTATFYDPNSGGHQTRTYRGPLDGLRIVNPRARTDTETVKAQYASADPGQVILDESEPYDPVGVSFPSARELRILEARSYLKSVAGAGGTTIRQGIDAVMTRLHATIEAPNIFAAFREALASGQVREAGIAVSIDRLHPDYALKLAEAVKDARASGLPDAHPFSCYRPPAYRVGGMRDKAASCHAYGLVCDMGGIGSARSSDSRTWAKIATRNGLHRPWKSAWEHNHWQLVPHRVCGTASMRATIDPQGPKDLEKMWAAGTRLAATAEFYAAKKRRYVKRRHHGTRVASR